MKRTLTGANRSGHLRIAKDDPNTERIHDMPDILEAAGDLIRTVEKDDVADESTRPELGDLWIAVGRGEWDLFVAAWNRAHDYMDEMSERQDARQGDDFVRLHEARMAAA